MGHIYFYDLPVYRLAEDNYYEAREKYTKDIIFPKDATNILKLQQLENNNPKINDALRLHLEKSYGGAWRYNEIIGYIRLHFLGTQIRGEYFAPNKKRIVRTRNRTIDFQTWNLIPEIDIQRPINNVTILHAVNVYIQGCRKKLSRRYIDTELFDALSPHINWLTLFNKK